jgi:hypothetical protein
MHFADGSSCSAEERPGLTIREQVWRALCKSGRPRSPAGLASALHLSRERVQAALYALAQAGWIEHPTEGVYAARQTSQRELKWQD